MKVLLRNIPILSQSIETKFIETTYISNISSRFKSRPSPSSSSGPANRAVRVEALVPKGVVAPLPTKVDDDGSVNALMMSEQQMSAVVAITSFIAWLVFRGAHRIAEEEIAWENAGV